MKLSKFTGFLSVFVFSFLGLLFFITPNAYALAQSTTLTAVADAVVYSGEENTNYGSLEIIEVGYSAGTGHFRESYIKFDLSSIPSNATVTSASFKNHMKYCEGDLTYIRTGQVTTNWVERLVTWKTKPSFTAGPTRSGACDNVEWWSFSVNQIVQNWINGQANYGFIIYSQTAASHLRSFDSSEYGGTANQPQLTIDYTIPDEPPVADPGDGNGDVVPDNPDADNPGGENPADPAVPDDGAANPDDANPQDWLPEDLIDENGDFYFDVFATPFGFLGGGIFNCIVLICCCLLLLLLLLLLILILKKRKAKKEVYLVETPVKPSTKGGAKKEATAEKIEEKAKQETPSEVTEEKK